MFRSTLTWFVLGVLIFPVLSRGQLMIPDSGAGDRVMLFNDFDGSVIDLNWITDLGGQFVFTTPKEAAVVGNEIWVSDQVVDAVHRFDMNRNFLGSITHDHLGNTLDNIRGFGFDGTHVYLTRFHGTSTLRGVVTINAATATATNFWQVGTNSLFDTLPWEGDLLVANNSTNNIERRDKATGTLISNFRTGITALQYLGEQADGSIITVSTIAAAGVEGVYHLNPDGSLRKFIDTEFLKGQVGEQVPRAAWVLGDGGYLIATSIGVFKAVETSPGNFAFSTMAAGVDAQFINPIPEPAALSLLSAVALLSLRRRR